MSSAEPVRFEDLAGLWQEGERRLAGAEPADRAAMERVVDELLLHLSRRVGATFEIDELVRLYLDEGTDWCFDIAVRVAPSRPAAWDLTTVAGAAFLRHARQASDYTLGRRVVGE
ncbi:MAG: hypothetical protein ACRDMX_01710 [Solirubrobacteraceae bacterium]